MPKRALFLSHIPFNFSAKVGSNFFAEAFAQQGFDVLYLANFLSPLHFGRGDFKQRWHIARRGVHAVAPNIQQWLPFALLPYANYPILRSEPCFTHWHRTTVPPVASLLQQRRWENPDIVFVDNLRYAPLLSPPSPLSPRKLVLRFADKNSSFKEVSPVEQAAELQLIKRADAIVFASSLYREEFVAEHPEAAAKAIHIANGLDAHHAGQEPPIPLEYRGERRKRVIFIGSIEYWIDVPLLRRCCHALPDVDFIFIGQIKHPDFGALQEQPNLKYLGVRKRDELFPYLHHADVGLMPFDLNLDLVHYVYPLKLFEYLAAGLPVVATRWRELERIEAPMRLAASHEQFIAELRAALHSGERVANFDLSQLRWSDKLQELMTFLGE